jgi:hypothetical protein
MAFLSSPVWQTVWTLASATEKAAQPDPHHPYPPHDIAARPIDARCLPYAIAKHTELVPTLVHNLRDHCEAHPHVEAAPRILKQFEHDNNYLATVLPTMTANSALGHIAWILDQLVETLGNCRVSGSVWTPAVGVLSRSTFKDRNDKRFLVLEAMRSERADTYFPKMDLKADENHIFNERATYI